MKDLMKKGKELIAMGESLCAMAGEEKGMDMDDSYEESESMDSGDKDEKKKLSIAALSKKFGKGEY